MNFWETKTGQAQQHRPSLRQMDNFYSVELLIQELKMLYQFKIWNSTSEPMFILVKEDSALLDQLKVGTVFKSRYYSTDSGCPTVDLETQIKQIARNDQGRFKGYYLIELVIIKDTASQTIH
ncbi:MAG: hypothetical protein AB1427_12515 [Thermodesulfobacteriota bacterium]